MNADTTVESLFQPIRELLHFCTVVFNQLERYCVHTLHCCSAYPELPHFFHCFHLLVKHVATLFGIHCTVAKL